MGFLSPLQKAVGKVTNSKVAKAVPGGKSIGKSLRNAPGMKQAPKPATGGLAPSPALQAKQLPMMQQEAPPPMESPTPAPMTPQPPPAPTPMPNQGVSMGEAMGRPSVMPRTPMMDEAQGGLAPQMDFAALAQRMPQRMPMRRPMNRAMPMQQM